MEYGKIAGDDGAIDRKGFRPLRGSGAQSKRSGARVAPPVETDARAARLPPHGAPRGTVSPRQRQKQAATTQEYEKNLNEAWRNAMWAVEDAAVEST